MKRNQSRRLFSLLLAIAMVLSLNATAFALNSLPPQDANVTSITLTGIDANSYTKTVTTFGGPQSNLNSRVVYDVVLPAGTASDAAFSIDFTKPSDNVISSVPPAGLPHHYIPMIWAHASDTYNVVLNDGVATQTVYVHKNFPTSYQFCDVYIFNFSIDERNNPVTAANGLKLRFGDPAYPNTEPECYLSMDSDSGSYRVNYNGPYGNTTGVPLGQSLTYYPDTFAFYVTEGAGTITAMSGTNMTLTVYDTAGNILESGSSLNTQYGAGFYVITLAEGDVSSRTLTITNSSGSAILNFLKPTPYVTPATGSPDFMNGYLPVGQFAAGVLWGSAYPGLSNVNGNAINIYPSITTDSPTKITDGYASGGISLGAPGGYAQFEFSNPVLNRAENPYGIDFVVYGNPFVGNPEAAAVKVSTDGSIWYELAGSRYYNEETKRNTTISYKMMPTSTYASNKKADIYRAVGTPPSGTGTDGWTLFKPGVLWWPESLTEGYGKVSGTSSLLDGTVTCSGITYQQLDEKSNGEYCWQITYSDVTLVTDSDTTDDYLFGYADIRAVGNNTEGAACNPYASLPSSGTGNMNGGDGFDISWAVDSNGEPVFLSSINFVRIYTAAALDPTSPSALTLPEIFGETSAEVCGVSVATGTGSGAATEPTIMLGNSSLEAKVDDVSQIENMGTVDVTGLGVDNITVSVTGATYSFVNGVSNSQTISLTDNAVHYVQIIAQSGTSSPYIIVLKLQK